ncbi:hypothetical protein BD413DRAFT_463755, partial [Trametes elegans]
FDLPALLVYETSITFDREMRHIWQRKASAATWLFLLNRYLVMALYAVGVSSTCSFLQRLSEVLDILSYVVWASFSGLRVYALRSRAWHVALLVFLLSLAPVWVYIVSAPRAVTIHFADLSQFRDANKSPVNQAAPVYCTTVATYPVSLEKPVCLILSDILVLWVTWRKTYGIVRLAREHKLGIPLSVTTVLLRDGQSLNCLLGDCQGHATHTGETGSTYFV